MGSRGTRGRTGSWVAGRLGEKRRACMREQVSTAAAWLAVLVGLAGGKGLGWAEAASYGSSIFPFAQTGKETEKHRVKGEEFENK